MATTIVPFEFGSMEHIRTKVGSMFPSVEVLPSEKGFYVFRVQGPLVPKGDDRIIILGGAHQWSHWIKAEDLYRLKDNSLESLMVSVH